MLLVYALDLSQEDNYYPKYHDMHVCLLPNQVHLILIPITHSVGSYILHKVDSNCYSISHLAIHVYYDSPNVRPL